MVMGNSPDESKSAQAVCCEAAEDDGPWILQSCWSRTAEKIGVLADDARMEFELSARKPLVAGPFWPTVFVDALELDPVEPREVSCWYADPDIQLVEMQINYAAALVVDRTVMLGVQDRFAVVLDVLTLPAPVQIGYQVDYALAEGIDFLEEGETREGYLRSAGRIQALVLPLALPEWKAERSTHSLSIETGRADRHVLRLRQERHGRGMVAATFFDLDPKRSLKPRTWRQLTVAKDLIIQNPDCAVAYRIRIGDQQWLLYRRVDPHLGCYRAFGQHFNCELFLGRIHRDDTIKELVKIDSPPVE